MTVAVHTFTLYLAPVTSRRPAFAAAVSSGLHR